MLKQLSRPDTAGASVKFNPQPVKQHRNYSSSSSSSSENHSKSRKKGSNTSSSSDYEKHPPLIKKLNSLQQMLANRSEKEKKM